MGSHKERGTTFSGKLVSVHHKNNAPEGPRQKPQRYRGIGICLYIVSEIISSDLDESQKLIFWCKNFCDSAKDWHP